MRIEYTKNALVLLVNVSIKTFISSLFIYIYIINTLLQFVVETARLKESIEDSKGDQIQRLILG